MSLRQITLTVRKEFDLPDVYRDGTFEEVEEALYIGSMIQQEVAVRRGDDQVRFIAELKDTELGRVKSYYKEQFMQLLESKGAAAAAHEKELKEMRSKMAAEWESKVSEMRKAYDIMAGKYAAILSEKSIIDEVRKKEIDDAVKRAESAMEKLVLAKEEQLRKVEAEYSQLNQVITKQGAEISRLTSTLSRRYANIKAKGSDYEEAFSEKLRRYYGLCKGFELKETRLGLGHEMDFSMNVEGHCVMWEVKNYGKMVPRTEVDKFLRDLKENQQARVGVMLSRSTDIYGKCFQGGLLTEFLDGKMVIYINRFEDFCGDDEARVFQMMMSLFRVWWEYHRVGNGVSFNREEIVRELEKATEDISKRRLEWRRHKAHLDEIGRWAADLLDESEMRLHGILKRVMGIKLDEVRDLVIPDGVFREIEGDREREWIESIMRVCEGGGQIEVRELVDLLSAKHKLSKDTIRSNIMAVVKDTSVIKRGVVKYIKGISKIVPKCQIKV